MNILPTTIADVWVFEPKIFHDTRGFFSESFNQENFAAATGLNPTFVQDNQAHSVRGALHGLHYQIEQAQGKLVRVVDIRKTSPTFGRWISVELSAANHKQIWIPAGCAHGFLVLSGFADVLYKTTQYYAPQYERCIAWNDPTLKITWPLDATSRTEPILSLKDKNATLFKYADFFP
jgi:dTDP-4-dehydrorhamnose 3,5-epimerase